MAKPTSDTDTIESLLEQRAQYEQWLAKLDAAANNAPAAVRQKVRGDYEARLRGVIDRLRGHAATISGELERHQGSQSDLDQQRRQAEEHLAEAEVRHAVGEYTEEEWQRISEESESRLQGLREQLGTVGKEIERLAEVQGLISAPARSEPAPPSRADVVEKGPPPPPPPVDEEVEAQPVVSAPPPRPAPRPAPAPSPAATAPGDEMAFLKSVADEEMKPATRRPSNPGPTQPAPSAPRAVETAPAPPGAKTGAPGVAKTLKCGECGTLNRPTEWYCERCGAELAGI